MNVTPLKNGIVLDHIKVGNGKLLYDALKLYELDCSVALIYNAESKKMGKKDVIKIDKLIDLDFNVISVIDKGTTVNVIKDGELKKQTNLSLPKTITNVLFCKNPRCITSVERSIDHVFKLTNENTGEYRCIYCEAKHKEEEI